MSRELRDSGVKHFVGRSALRVARRAHGEDVRRARVEDATGDQDPRVFYRPPSDQVLTILEASELSGACSPPPSSHMEEEHFFVPSVLTMCIPTSASHPVQRRLAKPRRLVLRSVGLVPPVCWTAG